MLPIMSVSMTSGTGSISKEDNFFAKAVQPLKAGISEITTLDTSAISNFKNLGRYYDWDYGESLDVSKVSDINDDLSDDEITDVDNAVFDNNGLGILHAVEDTGYINHSIDINNYWQLAMNELDFCEFYGSDGVILDIPEFSTTSSEDESYDFPSEIYCVFSNDSFDHFSQNVLRRIGEKYDVNYSYNSDWTYDALMTDGATKTIPINYASHYTQEEILNMVTAVDLFGQEVEFVVTSSDYEDAIGNYTIVLTATDSYGLTATCTLNIVVLDKSSPIIAKKNDYTADYGATITEADLFACVTASDNSGIDPTLSIQSDGGLNIGGAATFGTYTVVIKATDGAGNNATLPITVNVIDETAPVFTKNDGEVGDTVVYGYSETQALTTAVLINLFTATDYISGECPITTEDDINPAVGTHSMIFEAADDSGNTATLTVFYEIDADIPPVFILDSSLVQVSSDNPLTKANILSIVKSMIPDDAKYPTLTDETQFTEYLENSNVIGSKTTIDYSYVTVAEEVEDGSMVIEVIDEDGDGDGLFDDRNVFEKIGDWFKNIWNSIKTGFSEFGQKIKNLVTFKGWKTDEEVQDFSEVEETTSI